jgi:hypothetical protein
MLKSHNVLYPNICGGKYRVFTHDLLTNCPKLGISRSKLNREILTSYLYYKFNTILTLYLIIVLHHNINILYR